MDRVTLNIDGSEIVVASGTTILEAALQNNIYIPHLCYHPDLESRGACRLCIVELGNGQLVTSCRTPVEQGMVVKTKTPEVHKVLRPIVELLIADHHSTCRGCPSSGHCELQNIMAHLRVDRKRVRRLRLPGFMRGGLLGRGWLCAVLVWRSGIADSRTPGPAAEQRRQEDSTFLAGVLPRGTFGLGLVEAAKAAPTMLRHISVVWSLLNIDLLLLGVEARSSAFFGTPNGVKNESEDR